MLLKSFHFSVKGRLGRVTLTRTETSTVVSRGLKPLDNKFKNWWPESFKTRAIANFEPSR